MLDLTENEAFATIEFDRQNGKITCFEDLSICSMGLTVQFWHKALDWDSNCCIVSNGAELLSHEGFPQYPGMSFLQQDGQLVLVLATTDHFWRLTSELPEQNKWHFYEITFDPDLGWKLYIDNKLAAAASKPSRRGPNGSKGPFKTNLFLGICPAMSDSTFFSRYQYDDLRIHFASRDRLEKAGVIYRDVKYTPMKYNIQFADLKQAINQTLSITDSISINEALFTIHGEPEEVPAEERTKRALRFANERTNIHITPKGGCGVEDVNQCENGMTMRAKVRFHNLKDSFCLIDSQNFAVYFLSGSLYFQLFLPNRLVSRIWLVPISIDFDKWYQLDATWHQNIGLSVYVNGKLAGFQEDPEKVNQELKNENSVAVKGDIYIGRPHKALFANDNHGLGTFDIESIEFEDTSMGFARDIKDIGTMEIDRYNYFVDTVVGGGIPSLSGTYDVHGNPTITAGIGNTQALHLQDSKKQYAVIKLPEGSCLNNADLRRCYDGFTISAWLKPRSSYQSFTPFLMLGGKDVHTARMALYQNNSRLHAYVLTPTEKWYANGRSPTPNLWQFYEVSWHPVFGLSVFVNDSLIARIDRPVPSLDLPTLDDLDSQVIIGRVDNGKNIYFSDIFVGDIEISNAHRMSMLRAGARYSGNKPMTVTQDSVDFSAVLPNQVGKTIPCGASGMILSGPNLPKLDTTGTNENMLRFEGNAAGRYVSPVQTSALGISYNIKASFPDVDSEQIFVESKNFRLASLNGNLVGTYNKEGKVWSVSFPSFTANKIYNLSFSFHPVVGLSLWENGKLAVSNNTPSDIKIPHPVGNDATLGESGFTIGRGLKRGPKDPAFSKINLVGLVITDVTQEILREQDGKSAISIEAPPKGEITYPSVSNDFTTTTSIDKSTKEDTQRNNQKSTYKMPVRLIGGKSLREGRVEVLYQGTWGTICDDRFTNTIGEIVCKMLGHGALEATFGSDGNRWDIKGVDLFGKGKDKIHIDTDNFDCLGEEAELSDCIWDHDGKNDCQHSEDVGVRCRQPDGDDCASSPCFNAGTCTDLPWDYSCSCIQGYKGRNCEFDIDECYSDPCQNNAECLDEVNGYRCICNPGYAGVNCETEIDECDPNPCQHKGSCTDKVNAYECACVLGFAGKNCEIDIDDCRNAGCMHGAPCVDGINAFTCICPRGFASDRCEINVDECRSNPCLHGSCIDQIGGYRCICESNWDGPNCHIDKNECGSDPCENGAYCIDGFNKYTCQCLPGYEGKNCEIGK